MRKLQTTFFSCLGTILFIGNFVFAQETHFSLLDPKISADTLYQCQKPLSEKTTACKIYPVRTGNECQLALLTNGEQSLAARLATLRLPNFSTRQNQIRIETYVFTGDEVGFYLAEKLVNLKHKNPLLRIQVIVDGIANQNPHSQALYRYLSLNGIEFLGNYQSAAREVKENPFGSLATARFHQKIWAIDDQVAIVGGINLANEYLRVESTPKRRWRDQDIQVQGSIVNDITNSFDNQSEYLKPFSLPLVEQEVQLKELTKKTIQDSFQKDVLQRIKKADLRGFHPSLENSTCRWVANYPYLQETFITQSYLSMIAESKKEVLIANAYLLPSQPLIKALQQAIKNGAHVKIITNSEMTNDSLPFSKLSRTFYLNLLALNKEKAQGKLELFEWYGQEKGKSQTDGTLHAKFAVFDGLSFIIGSANFHQQSEFLNTESILVAQNAKLAATLRKRFYQKDLKMSRQITDKQAKTWDRKDKNTKEFWMGIIQQLKDSY